MRQVSEFFVVIHTISTEELTFIDKKACVVGKVAKFNIFRCHLVESDGDSERLRLTDSWNLIKYGFHSSASVYHILNDEDVLAGKIEALEQFHALDLSCCFCVFIARYLDKVRSNLKHLADTFCLTVPHLLV